MASDWDILSPMVPVWIFVAGSAALFVGGLVLGRFDARREAEKLKWLKYQTRELSRVNAEDAAMRMRAEQWAQFQPLQERLNEFAVFLNREFGAAMTDAQLQRPPLHFLDVTRNLLLELTGRKPITRGAWSGGREA
jgi:hypothetical protein